MDLSKYKKAERKVGGANARVYLCMPKRSDLSAEQIKHLSGLRSQYNLERICVDYLMSLK